MNEKQKYDIGDIVEIEPADKELFKMLAESEKIAQMAFAHASRMLRRASDELWSAVHESYPDLSNYRCMFISEHGEILVMGRSKSKDEEGAYEAYRDAYRALNDMTDD